MLLGRSRRAIRQEDVGVLTRSTMALSCLLWLACSTVDIDADWDPSARFADLHTWSWIEPTPEQTARASSPRIAEPLARQRIESAVQSVLTGRGYTEVSSGSPDFYVTYHLAVDQELDLQTTSTGGYGRWGYAGGWGSAETTVRKYDVGTLVIDVIDARARKLMWRCTAQSRIHDVKDAQERERRILDAVTRVLARFPPPQAS